MNGIGRDGMGRVENGEQVGKRTNDKDGTEEPAHAMSGGGETAEMTVRLSGTARRGYKRYLGEDKDGWRPRGDKNTIEMKKVRQLTSCR